MPRVYLTRADRQAAADLERDRAIRAAVTLYRMDHPDVRTGDLAVKLKMCKNSLWRKLRSPGEFTVSQLRTLRDAIGLTDEQYKEWG